jgi:hypothetical protein
MSGCSRSAAIHTDPGLHAPDGQRDLLAPRFASDPANVHSPCWHVGGRCFPARTAGVCRKLMTGRMSRPSHWS